MTKKTIFLFVIAVGLPIAYYLISPLWRVVIRDEPSPLEGDAIQPPAIRDALDSMSQTEMKQFEKAVEAMKDSVMEKSESMMPESVLSASGNFVARAHDVAGRALLIEQGNKKVLRFEDFDTINGPDLRIWLASDLSPDDYIDLGPIRATKGNVNYELPSEVDTNKYNKVLVWCRAFGVLFSYAELN